MNAAVHGIRVSRYTPRTPYRRVTLNRLSFALLCLFGLSLWGCDFSPAEAGCRTDDDCREGRVCVESVCQSPFANNVTPNNFTNNGTVGGTNNGQTADAIESDILFVIDNSGSMCQEQENIRQGAKRLFEYMAESGVDFHIGVTTTHMNPEYALEPVAKPGRLQATPQPVPGFDRSCHTAVDADGMTIEGDYAPIRASIDAAVDCMRTPDESFRNASNADIECALYGRPTGCSIARAGCGGDGVTCRPEHIFPPPESYRDIPRVLRAADYGGIGDLDVDAAAADFACMSFVGTRGYGIEKGLAAAVLAVDPELTGGAFGADGADESAPNHGLLRRNARFGLVFVTDENDCSHDGTLDEGTPCGGDVCAFANAVGAADSPLIDPETLRDDFIANLTASKGVDEIAENWLGVASAHGTPERYDGPVYSAEECASDGYTGIRPTCASSQGVAFSGDRYARFLEAFTFHYPQDLTKGFICDADFVGRLFPILEQFAEP